jgi:N-acetylmuramoyl-L-alanine amidase
LAGRGGQRFFYIDTTRLAAAVQRRRRGGRLLPGCPPWPVDSPMTLARASVALLIVFCWLCRGGPAAAAETREQAIGCLALAMYWEAKAEGAEGMRAVAAVVLNRVAHPKFPNTVCGVVRQGGEQPPCQFSWWCDGKSDRPAEADTWALAQRLARAILADRPRDPTRGALFFHSAGISTPWVLPRRRTVQIGHHIFYR